MANITRTFLRSDEMMSTYMQVMKEREEKGIKYNPFKEPPIKEFTHWVILENQFPYDAIAIVSHMLATRRNVPLDWKLLNKEEIEEFNELQETYLKEQYDVLWENLPKGQTIPGHFHLHLLVLRREEI
jgi:hypothetical protein